MLAVPMAIGAMLAMAEPSLAKPGNGNGGPPDHSAAAGGDPSATAQGFGSDDNPGRGYLASILKELNAAHASQMGLEHAAADSLPGLLYVYQQTGGITFDEIVLYNDLTADKAALEGLLVGAEDNEIELTDDNTDLAVYDLNADGVLNADDVAEYQAEIETYQDAYNALGDLGEDKLSLTADALDELNSLLEL